MIKISATLTFNRTIRSKFSTLTVEESFSYNKIYTNFSILKPDGFYLDPKLGFKHFYKNVNIDQYFLNYTTILFNEPFKI